jgi:cytochrome P450
MTQLYIGNYQTQDKAKQISQKMNFMPFGGGLRLCLGADFSKLFISLFLHVLVTKYR